MAKLTFKTNIAFFSIPPYPLCSSFVLEYTRITYVKVSPVQNYYDYTVRYYGYYGCKNFVYDASYM